MLDPVPQGGDIAFGSRQQGRGLGCRGVMNPGGTLSPYAWGGGAGLFDDFRGHPFGCLATPYRLRGRLLPHPPRLSLRALEKGELWLQFGCKLSRPVCGHASCDGRAGQPDRPEPHQEIPESAITPLLRVDLPIRVQCPRQKSPRLVELGRASPIRVGRK
jgi:hypothetical protein